MSGPDRPSYGEDRAEILELLARYALALDQRRFERLRDCFTPEAQVVYAGVRLAPGVEHVIEHVKGLAETAASQHMITTVSVEVDEDRATAMSYAVASLVRAAGEGHEVDHRGLSYEDELARTTHGWRIARRTHRLHWMTRASVIGVVGPVAVPAGGE